MRVRPMNKSALKGMKNRLEKKSLKEKQSPYYPRMNANLDLKQGQIFRKKTSPN
jgi:hypothetical protein